MLYFMENEIYSGNKKLPPRRNNICMIGAMLSFDLSKDLSKFNDDDDIEVLSENGNWYTIKKSEILSD